MVLEEENYTDEETMLVYPGTAMLYETLTIIRVIASIKLVDTDI